MAERRVRVWLGTRKGGYRLESGPDRRRWTIAGPFQEGNEVYHLVADPRRPGTVYSAANSSWWGPRLMRSRNWGTTWTEVSVPGTPRRSKRRPPVESPTAAFPIKNLWHLEPGPADSPRTLYLGVDPASLWCSEDEGANWSAVRGLAEHPSRPEWNPGAGGMCLHTILIDPGDARRMYVAISAAGVFRTEDGGAHWRPLNQRVWAPFLPTPYPPFGQCVHKVALDPADPSTLYRQDHGGMYVSHDRAESWRRIGKPLGDDFGMAVATAAALPGNAFFVPLKGGSRLIAGGHFQAYRWNDGRRSWSPLVRPGRFPGDFGLHREGMAADRLDPAGIYIGTTTGQLFWSRDAGKSWRLVPYQFPSIHSVSVSTSAA